MTASSSGRPKIKFLVHLLFADDLSMITVVQRCLCHDKPAATSGSLCTQGRATLVTRDCVRIWLCIESGMS